MNAENKTSLLNSNPISQFSLELEYQFCYQYNNETDNESRYYAFFFFFVAETIDYDSRKSVTKCKDE